MRNLRAENCSKAVTLFNKTDETLSEDSIDWDNTVGFGLYNTNSYMGFHNSLKSITIEKNPSCVVAGCNYHLVHVVVGRGNQSHANLSGFNCDENQCDLYYFFKESSRRKEILAEHLARIC